MPSNETGKKEYWLDDEKSPIVNGTNNGLPVQITENGKSKHVYQWTVSSEGTVDYPSSIYVEGVNVYGKTDTLMWRLLKPVTPVQPGDPTLVEKAVDTVKMTDPPFIDLAIDSDNDGNIRTRHDWEVFGKTREEYAFYNWEDRIENSIYCLGKVITSNKDEPIKLGLSSIPLGLSPEDLSVTFTFLDYVTSNPVPGAIALYHNNLRISSGQAYTLSNFGITHSLDGAYSEITLYVRGYVQNTNVKFYDDILVHAKQNTTIKVNLTGFSSNDDLLEDEVLYVVANENTFYYQMATDQAIRAAIASNAVYKNRQTLPKFGMEFLSKYSQYGHCELVDQVDTMVENSTDGFYACVYLDYTSEKHMVTFRGTDECCDFYNANIPQALGKYSSQYQTAMDIGVYVFKHETRPNEVLFTGHSLGGGLASFATFYAIAPNIPRRISTYTFNAALVQLEAILQPNITAIENRDRAKANYAAAVHLIKAYIVRGELVTYYQSIKWSMFANGDLVPLDHPFDLVNTPRDGVWSWIKQHGTRLSLHKITSVIECLERKYGIRE